MSRRSRSAAAVAPVFAHLPKRVLARIDALMTPASFADGQVLCREGHTGREAFLLVAGEAAVSRGDELIAELGPGDLVGEQALLSGEYRNATVTATGTLTAYVMSVREFATLMSIPAVAAAVRRLAEQRAPVVLAA